ncbi:FtsJ methyltransferase domain-containing protein 2 [Dinochytrium kinnereticum]|nr:FtsJ methyltransferase domain-containing protein 2 [Dinochytrium kinnereticum]
MPSSYAIYDADPDYQSTQAFSPIPPPKLTPSRDNRGGGGGGQPYRDNGRGGHNARDRQPYPPRYHPYSNQGEQRSQYRDERDRGFLRHDQRSGRLEGGQRGQERDEGFQRHDERRHQYRDERDGEGSRHDQRGVEQRSWSGDQRPQHRYERDLNGDHEGSASKPRESRGQVADHVQRFEWLMRDEAKSEYADNDLVMTVDKTQLTDYDLYCISPIVQTLHAHLQKVSELPQNLYTRARALANPYEHLSKSLFVNRSAVKLASIDRMMRHPPFSNGLVHGEKVTFADVCAGPGGFVEYLLWRGKMVGCGVRGWGMTLRGEQDFGVERFNEVSKRAAEEGGFEAIYGKDGSGDITKVENLKDFQDVILKGTDGVGVNVFMADGGFSCKGDELHQEFHTKKILTGQILSMFMCLQKGGDFILKTFTLFNPYTISLIHLLRTHFQAITIIKPSTSRPANSERYILCRNLVHARPERTIQHLSVALEKLEAVLESPLSGGVRVSSHSERPKGFVGVEERVAVGLMDLVEVVRKERVDQDEEFVEFLSGSNMKMCLKQTEALKLIEKLSGDEDSVSPFDQEETRIRCLKEWSLPY